jgi:queuine tRNA-ribosyltransferase
MFDFQLLCTDGKSGARRGRLSTPHGVIETPIFMPVGTHGALKAMTPAQVEEAGAQIILSNTYHLHLSPGEGLIEKAGGLHHFMHWPHPILTDSGGFQVFSLPKKRITEDGVFFRHEISGEEVFLGPREAMDIQNTLGADIIMAFDECIPFPATHDYAARSIRKTLRWAEACLKHHRRTDQALFGIVQGGVFPDLREQSARFLTDLDFAGYAIGGLSVGETKAQTHAMLEVVDPLLPVCRPRYLMGVGTPGDLVEGVARGVDMFDCVLPTRMARTGTALTRTGRINLRNARFADDPRPIEAGCTCYACAHFSRAYIRHLALAREILAHQLLSIHNLHVLLAIVRELREAILADGFQAYREAFWQAANASIVDPGRASGE